MHAVDIYGLSEIMGPGVANECVETKDGLHVWEDHFYPEIIDPETGEVAARRRRGRAGLHLAHQGRHADRSATAPATLTRLLPGTARTMRRMEKITGRSDDMIILRGVNVFPTQIEEQADGDRGLPRTSRSNCTNPAAWTPCGCLLRRHLTQPTSYRKPRLHEC